MKLTIPWFSPLTSIVLSMILLLKPDWCTCLSCWHCIAENCDDDPADNYRATKKECAEGQICQKVYFEMFSQLEQKRYESTVRGCSPNCEERDDFSNCSTLLRESRGCIKKTCCADSDLCNPANRNVLSAGILGLLLLCLVNRINVNLQQYL